MKLSIIIPAYGVERYLGRCLMSLLHQDLSPDEFEILVIEDGSPDQTYEVAARVAERHSNVRIQRQENRGLGATRNTGLALATGDFVWFVDGDDHVMPDRFASIITTMERDRLQVLALEHRSVPEDRYVFDDASVRDPAQAIEVTSGVTYIARTAYTSETAMYVFDRRFLLDSGLTFTEGYFTEDVVYTAQALVAADRVARLPGLVYVYVQRADSLMHRRSPDHVRRFVAWFSSMAIHLAEVRDRVAADPGSPPGSAERLQLRVETLVFFLIARWVRSSLSLEELPATLEQMRAIGGYPMATFPGDERPTIPYRLLRWIFDRPRLLPPFAAGVRTLMLARRQLARLHR